MNFLFNKPTTLENLDHNERSNKAGKKSQNILDGDGNNCGTCNKKVDSIATAVMLMSTASGAQNQKHINKGDILFYCNMFKENEELLEQGLPPKHKIYEHFKFVRPIKRKQLTIEIMKELERDRQANNPTAKPIEKLDFGLDNKNMQKYLKSIKIDNIINQSDKNFGLRETILDTCKAIRRSKNKGDKDKFLEGVRKMLLQGDETSENLESKQKFLEQIKEYIENDQLELEEKDFVNFESKFQLGEEEESDSNSDDSSKSSGDSKKAVQDDENLSNKSVKKKKGSEVNMFAGFAADETTKDIFTNDGELKLDNLLSKFAKGMGIFANKNDGSNKNLHNKKESLYDNTLQKNNDLKKRKDQFSNSLVGIKSFDDRKLSVSLQNIDVSVYSKKKRQTLKCLNENIILESNQAIPVPEKKPTFSKSFVISQTPTISRSAKNSLINSIRRKTMKLPDTKHFYPTTVKVPSTFILDNPKKAKFSTTHNLREKILARTDGAFRISEMKNLLGKSTNLDLKIVNTQENSPTKSQKDYRINTSLIQNHKKVPSENDHRLSSNVFKTTQDQIYFMTKESIDNIDWNKKKNTFSGPVYAPSRSYMKPFFKGFVTNPEFAKDRFKKANSLRNLA